MYVSNGTDSLTILATSHQLDTYEGDDSTSMSHSMIPIDKDICSDT